MWKSLIIQSFLAGAILFVLTVILGREKLAAISAISASAFIVFALPETESARAKNVVGSHVIGLLAGSAIYLTGFGPVVEYPLAVGLTCFLMAVMGVIHPPAAGTALSMVINKGQGQVFVGILLGVVILAMCHYLLKGRIKNLI